jgi:hypothetical protein
MSTSSESTPSSQASRLHLGKDEITTSHYLAEAAVAAYQDDPREYEKFASLGLSKVVPFKTGHTSGYVAAGDRDIVLAFRGTNDILDWIANLNFAQVDALGGRVHRGFYQTLQTVWKPMTEGLGKLYERQRKPRLWVTGHSLGGALAVLASKSISQAYPVTATYTYGQPRVGDQNFAENYKNKLIRLVTARDAVPQVLLGDLTNWYRHLGEEEWKFDQSGKWARAAGLESIVGGIMAIAANLPWGSTFDVTAVQKHVKSVLDDHNMPTYLAKIQANLAKR